MATCKIHDLIHVRVECPMCEQDTKHAETVARLEAEIARLKFEMESLLLKYADTNIR